MKKWLWALLALAIVAALATRNLWMGGGRLVPTPAPRSAPHAPPVAEGPTPAACVGPDRFAPAARQNAAALHGLAWSPFGVAELGFDAYAPAIGQEVGTRCPPGSPGFASALADWQSKNGLAVTGLVDAATFEKMRVAWMLRRPFVQLTRSGYCPPPADPSGLSTARQDEGYWGKSVQLRPDALSAYRRLVAAARRESPAAAGDANLLDLVSGFRPPDGLGGGPAKASCSAHRTGAAVDLFVGAKPGFDPTSSTDENRTWQAEQPIYRWLAANAWRFGFVSYPYEPWHWEYAG